MNGGGTLKYIASLLPRKIVKIKYVARKATNLSQPYHWLGLLKVTFTPLNTHYETLINTYIGTWKFLKTGATLRLEANLWYKYDASNPADSLEGVDEQERQSQDSSSL